MTGDFDELFRPLEASGLFVRTSETESVIYSSPNVSLTVTHNWRDGVSGYLLFPALGSKRVSLDTLVEALKSAPPGVGEPVQRPIADEVGFILHNFERLHALPPDTYEDLCGLQFWHGITWQKKWGSTIALTSTRMCEENARLARLKTYFHIAKV